MHVGDVAGRPVRLDVGPVAHGPPTRPAAERVELRGPADRHCGVEEQGCAFVVRFAVPLKLLRPPAAAVQGRGAGCVVRVGGEARGGGAGPDGRPLLRELHGNVEEAVVAQPNSGGVRRDQASSVAPRRSAQPSRGGDAFGGVLEHNVYRSGDGVRSVLGSRPAAKHFDPLDRRKGDCAQIGARRSQPERGDHLGEGGLVTALAVDQDEHLVRVHAPKRGDVERGPVADAQARGVEGGDDACERFRQIGLAETRQRFRVVHVDRNQELRRVRRRRPGPDHDGAFLRRRRKGLRQHQKTRDSGAGRHRV